MNITAPRSEQAELGDVGGFTLAVRAALSGLSISGSIGDLPLTLSVDGVDVMSFTLPGQSAAADATNIIDASVPVSVASLAAFGTFSTALLQRDVVSVRLVGQATLTATIGGIRVTISQVPFDKYVSVPGAGGLRGSEVTFFSLAGSNATAAVVNMTVVIPNRSPVGIYPLGDIGVGVYYGGSFLGTAQAGNVSLSPSSTTTLSLTGTLVPQGDPAGAASLDALISDYLRGATVNVTAVGIPQASGVPLFAPFITALNLTAALQGTATPLVAGIEVGGLDLIPLSPSTLAVGLNATVGINSPLGGSSPISVNGVGLNVSLEGAGAVVGSLFAPFPSSAADDAPKLSLSRALLAAGAPLVWRKTGAAGPLALAIGGADNGPTSAVVNVSLSLSATLTIDSASGAFGDFITAFVNSPFVPLGLVGNGSSSLTVALSSVLGELQVSVPITARTSVPGINGFSLVEVQSFAVTGVRDAGPAGPAAILVSLNVAIGNPSPATFPLGEQTTLGIYSGGFRIGESVAVNQTLAPGVNVLSLAGTLTPPSESLEQASAFFSDYLNGVNGSVTVEGEDVTLGPGRDTPAWLLRAVRNISLSAALPGATGLSVLTDFSFGQLGLSFAAPQQTAGGRRAGSPRDPPPPADAVPVLSGTVLAAVHLPFSIPVTIPSANVTLTLVDPDSGTPFAILALLNQPATFSACNVSAPAGRRLATTAPRARSSLWDAPDPCTLPPPTDGNAPIVGSLSMVLQPTVLTVLDSGLMAGLITRVLNSDSADVVLSGTADVLVGTAVGTLRIANVSVTAPVTLPGMGGFAASPPQVYDVRITTTSSQQMNISVVLNLTNPAPVSGSLGPVTLGLAYDGVEIAQATVDDLALVPGVNVLSAHGTFILPNPVTDPSAYDKATDFIARYLSALTSVVTLAGSAASSPIALVQPAFAAFSVGSLFPPIERGILVNGTL